MRLIPTLFASFLFLALAPPAVAEGAHPLPGVAETAVALGAGGSGDYAGDGAFVFQNEGGATLRLMLPSERDRVIECTTDGDGTSRSRAGQFMIAGGAALHCTAAPSKHRFTAISTEGGSVREIEGKLVVR
jgi:hypothetical protein